MRIPDYIALGVLIVLIVWAVADWFPQGISEDPKTACGRSHKLAIGLNSRSAIRDWRGITNRISDAARIAKRASDQNGGIGSSARLEPEAPAAWRYSQQSAAPNRNDLHALLVQAAFSDLGFIPTVLKIY
jgi:hypothetical protein